MTGTRVEVKSQKPQESPALKRAIQNAARSAEENAPPSKFLASFY
jgi:hypothetical protein